MATSTSYDPNDPNNPNKKPATDPTLDPNGNPVPYDQPGTDTYHPPVPTAPLGIPGTDTYHTSTPQIRLPGQQYYDTAAPATAPLDIPGTDTYHPQGSPSSNTTTNSTAGRQGAFTQADIDAMKAANPAMFKTDQDAINWGKRYYGWTDDAPSLPGAASAVPGATPTSPTSTPAPAPTTAPAPGTTTTGTTTTTSGTIPGTPDPGTGGANTDFMNTLLALLHPGAIDQNDPRISGAIAANNLALQRGAEAQRAQQAEVNAQTGIDASGGANTMNQGILEDMAGKQGQFAGQEVQHLGDQQNQDMLASLGALGAFLPQQEQIANQWAEHEATLTEQAREADVDAALKKLGIETQGNLGQADIALRDKLGASQEGLALLSTLLQMQEFGAGLDSQTILGLLGSVG